MGYRNSGYRNSEVNWSYWKTVAWGGVATTWAMLGLSAMGFTTRQTEIPASPRADDSDSDLTAEFSPERVDSADASQPSRPVASPEAISSLPSVSMPAVDYSRPATSSSSSSARPSPSRPRAAQPATAPTPPPPSPQTVTVRSSEPIPIASNRASLPSPAPSAQRTEPSRAAQRQGEMAQLVSSRLLRRANASPITPTMGHSLPGNPSSELSFPSQPAEDITPLPAEAAFPPEQTDDWQGFSLEAAPGGNSHGAAADGSGEVSTECGGQGPVSNQQKTGPETLPLISRKANPNLIKLSIESGRITFSNQALFKESC